MLENNIEAKTNLLESALSDYKFVMHGNSSEVDVAQIRKHGMKFVEGRATFTTNLAHALDWATSKERREAFSMSPTQKQEAETGVVFVIKVPSDYRLFFGTRTSIVVDDTAKTISGDTLKYISGFKQLGMYHGNVAERKAYFRNLKLAERPQLSIPPDLIVSEIIPDGTLTEVIGKVVTNAKSLVPMPDISQYPELIQQLLQTTYQSAIVLRIRALAVELRMLTGYQIYNQGEKVSDSPQLNPQSALRRLLQYEGQIAKPKFSLGFSWLEDYVRSNVRLSSDFAKQILSALESN